MKFADFICIGPPKAGTTWMFEQLRHHPQVFIGIKEPNFFGQNTPLVRYAAHFAEANGRLCGDLSPQYSKHPSIAARIYDLLPQAKIIYSLREPARRAFSQWKMARRLGNIPAEMSFRDAFEEDRSAIRTRGEYTKFVEAYRSLFGDRFLILWFDDIAAKPAAVTRQLAQFLGIDPEWVSPDLAVNPNPNRDRTPISDADLLYCRSYYDQWDRELMALMRLARLPWG